MPRLPPASRSSAAAPGPASAPKLAEAGGIDLLVIYNSGRFRMGAAVRSPG
ncbi:MAG: hypothetical protein R3C10_22810 [Pirellulales bacterium]